jgi:hypothetical protein
MGWGDEIMALGRAERQFMRTGRPVSIVDAFGLPRKNPLWDHSPAWKFDCGETITDGPGERPYIERWEGNRIILNMNHRPRAGHVILTQEERDTVTIEGPFAVVSPNIKANASVNKSWGAHKWREAIHDFPLPVFQLGPEGTTTIRGANLFVTPTIRHAAAVIERAAIVLTNEGGSHHLAASLKRPAVVVFGGFMHPNVTGYPEHANLIGDAAHVGCGKYDPCEHCRKSLDNITPGMVKHAAQGQLNGRNSR